MVTITSIFYNYGVAHITIKHEEVMLLNSEEKNKVDK